jgi:hypothetical protein
VTSRAAGEPDACARGLVSHVDHELAVATAAHAVTRLAEDLPHEHAELRWLRRSVGHHVSGADLARDSLCLPMTKPLDAVAILAQRLTRARSPRNRSGRPSG